MFFNRNKERSYTPTPWELAVLEQPPKKPVSINLLRSITGDLARNDIRVVVESVRIALMSPDADTRKRRRALAEERYRHLNKLKPFMDDEQLKVCASADDAMRRL